MVERRVLSTAGVSPALLPPGLDPLRRFTKTKQGLQDCPTSESSRTDRNQCTGS